jgi:hypothetical protein
VIRAIELSKDAILALSRFASPGSISRCSTRESRTRRFDEIAWYRNLFEAEVVYENPVGVLYDPDALLNRFEAGEQEESLLAIPAGPPSPIPAAHGMT